MPEPHATPFGCLSTLAVFLLVVAPVYMVLRFLVMLVRHAYGFDMGEDEGPPLRVCSACHNSVLEADYAHCPYCGAELPPVPGAEAPDGEAGPGPATD